MFPTRIVEAVDLCEEGDLDLATGLPVAMSDEFGLRRLKDTFDGRIVVAIAPAAHRNLEAMLAQQFPAVVGTELRSTARAMNAARWRPSDRDRHVQGPQGEILLQEIGCDFEGVIAVGGALELSASDDLDAVRDYPEFCALAW